MNCNQMNSLKLRTKQRIAAQCFPSRARRLYRVVIRYSMEPNGSSERQLEKVSVADLPKPNPKAMQTLQRSNQKTGFNKLIVDSLKGTAFTVIGEDEQLIESVAQRLATRLGWYYVSTRKVVSGIMKAQRPAAISPSSPSSSSYESSPPSPPPSETDLEATFGREALASAEAAVLKGMRTQRKVVIATMPRGCTGLTDQAYDDLLGSIILRVDEEVQEASGAKGGVVKEERDRRAAFAEIELKVKKGKGFATAGASADEKAKEAMESLMQLVANKLNQDKELVERKGEYIANGFKGWTEKKKAEFKETS